MKYGKFANCPWPRRPPLVGVSGELPSRSGAEPCAARRQPADGLMSHRTISGGVGHNLPQEAPDRFVEAVVDVARLAI